MTYATLTEFIKAQLTRERLTAWTASGSTVVGSAGAWRPSPDGDEWEAQESPEGDEELLVALRPGLVRPPGLGSWGVVVSTSADQRGVNEEGPMDAFRHAALHDPYRVLRRVAAVERMLARHRRIGDVLSVGHGDLELCYGCGTDEQGNYRVPVQECPELRDAATAWDDLPGYQERWQPGYSSAAST